MIECSDVAFAYRRGEPIIDGFSYRFEPGTMTALVGPSGSGKSTLLYLCGLLLHPTTGMIKVAGTPQVDRSDAQRAGTRAREIGFVFQDASLDPTRSVIDNITESALYSGLPRVAAITRARDLMERLGVTIRATHRPGEISGGQAQRVAMCRALLNDPSIILADEPTGNLDAVNGLIVVSLLEDAAASGKTVVLATHDLTLADAAHQVIEVGP